MHMDVTTFTRFGQPYIATISSVAELYLLLWGVVGTKCLHGAYAECLDLIHTLFPYMFVWGSHAFAMFAVLVCII